MLANERHRIRRHGAGRKTLLEQDPTIRIALECLVEPMTVGDPETPFSLDLQEMDAVVARTAGARIYDQSHVGCTLLKEMGYGLQGNRKTLEGKGHPDRNAQFEFINEKADSALLAGQPVISVDTKKKEWAGQFKNGVRKAIRIKFMCTTLWTKNWGAPIRMVSMIGRTTLLG